jgi:hypothetical protein
MGTGTCTAPEVRTTEGTTCQAIGSGTQICSPFANLTCVSGTCRRIGTGAAGSSCMTGDFFELFSCNEGLYCERSSRTCRSRLATGTACESDIECQSRSCVNMRCTDRRCD